MVLYPENKNPSVLCFVLFFNLEENKPCLFVASSMEPGAISCILFHSIK